MLYTEGQSRSYPVASLICAVIASIVFSVSARFEEKKHSLSFPSASAGINHLYL